MAEAVAELSAGVRALACLLGRTLGPATGPVLYRTESLTDSAVLARRVTALAGPHGQASVQAGVQALRSLCLAMHQRYGDGAATAAVLTAALVERLARLVPGGADPVVLRRGVERGVAAATRALADAAVEVADEEELTGLATAAAHDPVVGAVLGELFDVLGPAAGLVVEVRDVPGVDREYVDGARWRARPAYREVLPDGATELTLADPLVLVADAVLSTVEDVLPALETAARARKPLVLVCRGLDAAARTLVARNRNRATVVPVCLVPGARADLADLALLTGATVLADALGRGPRSADPTVCGTARRAVLGRDRLTVTGGAGGPVESRLAELAALSATVDRGSAGWRALRLRAARLSGAQGVVVVGGYTERDRAVLTERVAKAQRVLELALTEGVLPGGGVAYLDCVPAVRAVHCDSDAERWGVDAVAEALAAPFRQLMRNHRHPDTALTRLTELGPGWGIDLRDGRFAPMAKAGVLDSAGTLRAALVAAGSLAATVATTASIVRVRA
jgi:chaperonin GroEL